MDLVAQGDPHSRDPCWGLLCRVCVRSGTRGRAQRCAWTDTPTRGPRRGGRRRRTSRPGRSRLSGCRDGDRVTSRHYWHDEHAHTRTAGWNTSLPEPLSRSSAVVSLSVRNSTPKGERLAVPPPLAARHLAPGPERRFVRQPGLLLRGAAVGNFRLESGAAP